MPGEQSKCAVKAAPKTMNEKQNGGAAESARVTGSDLVQAASAMVAVTHFSGCIDGSTVEARDYLGRALTAFRGTGAALISAERQRQIEMEGYEAYHDDSHDGGELADAATCYANVASVQSRGAGMAEIREMIVNDWGEVNWPWHDASFKPVDNPIANLVKAGALIAAEIDRLQRKQKQSLP